MARIAHLERHPLARAIGDVLSTRYRCTVRINTGLADVHA